MPTENPPKIPTTIPTEKLAYWFFRLNGCLTIENFVVHPDQGRDQRTDADILGIRFPHRAELLQNPMEDHPTFKEQCSDRPLLFVAEVKGKTCRLNGPWTEPHRENIQRVLRAMGALHTAEIEAAAQALYEHKKYDSSQYAVRLFALADEVGNFATNYPNAIPITWTEALTFIYERFHRYQPQKSAHGQWDFTGRRLWNIAMSGECRRGGASAFVKAVRHRLVDVQGNYLAPREESPQEVSEA